MHRVKLLSCGNFVLSPKISTNDLSSENYITTDNMLPDKAGITKTDNIPFDINVTKFLKNDILLSNIRPYFKKIWLAEYTGGCSADVLVFRTNDKYDPKYIKYCLSQDIFFAYDMAGSKGSKMPRGDKNHILNFELLDYDLKTQQIIGNLLLSIDKKIELNNKINSELENIAKTLYDYWFVQFDFPAENGRPYKSSGGKMVYNPILKRYIPIGWEVKSLSDIANIIMGQSPRGNSYNTIGKGMPFHQGCANFGDKFPIAKQYTTEPNRIANIGDFLISIRAPVGCLNIAIEECCIGRGLVAIHSKTNNNEYLYQILQNLKKQFELRNSMGTTFGSITKDDLFGLIVIKPKDNVLKSYKKICQNISLKQYNLFLENVKLTKIRDFLLPMLMNGQVTIQH